MNSADLKAHVQAAANDIRERWQAYVAAVHFGADVPLSVRIESFVTPAREYLRQNHPRVDQAPAGTFWTVLVLAVLNSRTHTAEEVNCAIEEIRLRF